jgi:hypothetical protein
MNINKVANWHEMNTFFTQLTAIKSAEGKAPFMFYAGSSECIFGVKLPPEPEGSFIDVVAGSLQEFNKFNEGKFGITLFTFISAHPECSNILAYDAEKDSIIFDIGKHIAYAPFQMTPIDGNIRTLVQDAHGMLYVIYPSSGFATALYLMGTTGGFRLDPEKASQQIATSSSDLFIQIVCQYNAMKVPARHLLQDAHMFVKPASSICRYPKNQMTALEKFIIKKIKSKAEGKTEASDTLGTRVLSAKDLEGSIDLASLKNVIIPYVGYCWVDIEFPLLDISYMDITDGNLIVHYTGDRYAECCRTVASVLGTTKFIMVQSLEGEI